MAHEEEKTDEAPKLYVDSDWKAEAQAEKERLSQEEEQREKSRAERGPRGMPEASFKTLMSVMASQAIMGLGAITDPKSGGVVIDLEGAKLSIDLLAILEEKTKGNLSEEEASEMSHLVTELRSRFVQVAQLVAQQAQSGGGPAAVVSPAPEVEGG